MKDIILTNRRLASAILYILLPFPAFAVLESGNQMQFQLLQSQYLSESQGDLQTQSYTSLGVRTKFASEQTRTNRWGVDAMGLGSIDGTEQAYFAAPEAYFATQFSRYSKFSLVLGRYKTTWSKFDDEWRLGIWQPYVRWDYLHPTAQGLTGMFLFLGDKRVSVKGFATPVFLPDQGPQFTVENGEFHSSNRWFRQPRNNHSAFGEERRLNYELKKPSEEDVILHSGFGLSVLAGNEESGPWLRMAVANKPINQFHLGIDGFHSVAPQNRLFESTAVVHPKVVRHSIVTIEAGLQGEDLGGWVSLTEERPQESNMPEEWAEASLYPSRFWGVTVAQRLPWQGFRQHFVKYMYMSLNEELPTNQQERLTDNVESSLGRYPYKSVAGLEWTAPFLNSVRHRLDLGLRYLYSIPEQGGLLSAQATYQVEKDLRWNLGFDIIGANVSDDSSDAGLMSRYRHNDRVIGGVTYVF